MRFTWRDAGIFVRATVPWWLWGFCLLLPSTIAGLNIGAGILCGFVVISSFYKPGWDYSRLRQPALYSVAVYCLAALVAALAGATPQASLRFFFKEIHKLWFLALAMLALSEASTRRWAPVSLGIGFVFSSLVGMTQAFHQYKEHQISIRAHGIVHPVTYGDQMALACLGAFCFLGRGRKHRRPLYFFMAVALTALALNQTRTAFLALAAGVLAVALIYPDKRVSPRWVCLAGLLTIGLWEVIPTGNRSFSGLIEQLAHADPHSPHLARFALWDVAWRMFKDHPWTGVGPGGYRALFTAYHPQPVDGEAAWGSAHDLFLTHMAERGLVGLTSLLAVFYVMTTRAFSRARKDPNPWNLWAWGTMVAFMVMNLTEEAFDTQILATLVLFIWAAAEGTTSPPSQR